MNSVITSYHLFSLFIYSLIYSLSSSFINSHYFVFLGEDKRFIKTDQDRERLSNAFDELYDKYVVSHNKTLEMEKKGIYKVFLH